MIDGTVSGCSITNLHLAKKKKKKKKRREKKNEREKKKPGQTENY